MRFFVILFNVVGMMVLCPTSVFASMQADMEKEVVNNNHEQEKDIYKTVGLDEVVVSANKNEVKRCDAPVVVSVIGAKLFETVNSPDLAKSLNYQSGLRVENNCQNCGFPQVRINGLEGPYSQILINSRPVVSALSGVYGLEQIPVNMIDRIEVVRGGGSALFGANAVGGTINIITKDPKDNSFQVSNTLSLMGSNTWEENMGANASIVDPDNKYGLALDRQDFGAHLRTPRLLPPDADEPLGNRIPHHQRVPPRRKQV